MKTAFGILCALILVVAQPLSAQHFTYVSPKPSSGLVSLSTNIILRCDRRIDESTIALGTLNVRGASSGPHAGRIALSDDGQTLLFTLESPLSPSEQVFVALGQGIKTETGLLVDPIRFSFTTATLRRPLTDTYAVDEDGVVLRRVAKSSPALPVSISADSLPSDFPRMKVDTTSNPAPGYYLLTTTETQGSDGYYLFMIDNTGKVVRYKGTGFHLYDFKQQANGLYSYAEGHSEWGYAGGSRVVHRVVDSTLAPVDSFKAGNGYDADGHEFRILANGHALLHAYDIQYFDLSTTIPGGSPNAIVVGSILQELDLNRNVVFQWRSWDYIPISDTYMSTTAAAFDYIHVNAFDIDDDGNILACFRNTCDIVKIDRMTGAIMWRMGGKHNEFTFIGENEANKPTYYAYQHGLRKLANGNFLLFDNGNLHTQKLSRAVEYKIDQTMTTATLVWEYRHTPDIFAPTRGSVQRLANGNTVVGWGSASLTGVGKQAFTEVLPNKSTVCEMEFVNQTASYRAQKYLLGTPFLPADSVRIAEILRGNTYRFKLGDSIQTGISMVFNQMSGSYNSVYVKRYGFGPKSMAFTGGDPFVQAKRWVMRQTGITSFNVDITFDSTALAGYANKGNTVVYSRQTEGSGAFAPLTSVYDSAKSTLTATTTQLGEFIIGVPEKVGVPATPTLVTPAQQARVNQTQPIPVRWNSFGHITGSHLQIARDTLFATLVVNDSTVKSTWYNWSGGLANTKYFWRVKAKNEQGTSSWSDIGVFSTAAPYIAVTDPQINAALPLGSTFTIRWDSNVGSFVKIRLLKKSAFSSSIIDSVENTGRYVWKLPKTGIVVDSSYAVRVMVAGDTTTYADSKTFSITAATGVDDGDMQVTTYSLSQNYPNPFNPTTTINFSLPSKSATNAEGSITTLKVYDSLGREVAVLVNEPKAAGVYTVFFDGAGLASGMYLYRIQSGSYVDTRRMILLR